MLWQIFLYTYPCVVAQILLWSTFLEWIYWTKICERSRLWAHSAQLPFRKVVPGAHVPIAPVSFSSYPCRHWVFSLILANLIDGRCYLILISLITRRVGHVPCVSWSFYLSPWATCSCPLPIFCFPYKTSTWFLFMAKYDSIVWICSICLIMSWWAFGLLPLVGYYECCCCEHWCTSFV